MPFPEMFLPKAAPQMLIYILVTILGRLLFLLAPHLLKAILNFLIFRQPVSGLIKASEGWEMVQELKKLIIEFTTSADICLSVIIASTQGIYLFGEADASCK